MKKVEINCVKLQRALRDQAYRKYGHLSLHEEMEEVRKNLKAKGLDSLFSATKTKNRGSKKREGSRG